MTKSSRKTLIRFSERAAVGLVILDVIIYLVVVRPRRSEAVQIEDSYHHVLASMNEKQQRVAEMEQAENTMPAAGDQLQTFLQDHVPSRRRGFSQAVHLVRSLTGQTGVQLDSVSYKLTSEEKEPFDRLGIDVTVEGPYTNLLKFAHALETSPKLVLIRTFSITAATENSLSLQVAAELYLTP